MAKPSFCPGAANIRGTPELKEKICPECGRVIELFSGDTEIKCPCGFVAYNDEQSCINWCKHARDCVGDEVFERITQRNKIPLEKL